MARTINDGVVRVVFATTIANTAAPTAAEIGAGTNITPLLSSLSTPLDGEATPSQDLSSAFKKTVAGPFGGEMTGEFYRDDVPANDVAWPLFPRNTTGYIVIRRFGGSDVAIVATDDVEVWAVRVITRSMADMDAGSLSMFTVNFATLDEPDIDVAVV